MRHKSVLFSAFLILMIAAGCWHPGFLRETEESSWYQMRLLDAQLYNSKFAHLEKHDRKEIWVIEIESVEDLQIWASSQKCLYAHSGSLTGYCFGGDKRFLFLLKTYFLKTPLKKGDVIIFSAFHRTVHSVLDGDATLHLIEGTSMAKVDPETGEPTPLEYDQAAFLTEAEAEKTFRRLCIAKAKGLQPLEQALKDGANPNVTEGRGRHFLIYCLERWETSPEELKLLLRYGAQPKFAQYCITPLSVAAAREKDPLTFCRILLEAGADPNQNPGYKNALSRVAVPPLFIAVRRNHLKLAELLLEHGADPLFNLPPPFFSMPLHPETMKPTMQRPLGWRPIDEVRDYRMAELLMKYIGAKPVKSPSMMKVINERITAPVPEE